MDASEEAVLEEGSFAELHRPDFFIPSPPKHQR